MVPLMHMANIVTESMLGPETEHLLRCGTMWFPEGGLFAPRGGAQFPLIA